MEARRFQTLYDTSESKLNRHCCRLVWEKEKTNELRGQKQLDSQRVLQTLAWNHGFHFVNKGPVRAQSIYSDSESSGRRARQGRTGKHFSRRLGNLPCDNRPLTIPRVLNYKCSLQLRRFLFLFGNVARASCRVLNQSNMRGSPVLLHRTSTKRTTQDSLLLILVIIQPRNVRHNVTLNDSPAVLFYKFLKLARQPNVSPNVAPDLVQAESAHDKPDLERPKLTAQGYLQGDVANKEES